MTPRRFHEPALAAALALSIAPRTVAQVGRVREAQRLRGLPTGGVHALPALAVPVLERGMEEAVTLAESMDARGHGRGRRTRYRPQPWTIGAVVVAGAAVLSAGAFLVAAWIGRADLHPATSPLRWPGPDLLLIAAMVPLLAPGLLRRGG